MQSDVGKNSAKKNENRLRRKLKLQEMRCNLMASELKRLKEAIATTEKDLQKAERRIKLETRRRKIEERKRKESRKELAKIKKENEKNLRQLKSYKKKLAAIESKTPNKKVNNEQQRSNSDQSNQVDPDKPSSSTAKEKPTQEQLQLKTKTDQSADLCKPGPSWLDEPMPVEVLAKETPNNESSSSGIPRDSLNLDDYFESELMCSICHEFYISPVLLSCCHVFCKYCIFEWRKKNHNCPICRTFIYNVHADQILSNIVDKVLVTMSEEAQKKRKVIVEERLKYKIDEKFGLEEDQRRHDHSRDSLPQDSETGSEIDQNPHNLLGWNFFSMDNSGEGFDSSSQSGYSVGDEESEGSEEQEEEESSSSDSSEFSEEEYAIQENEDDDNIVSGVDDEEDEEDDDEDNDANSFDSSSYYGNTQSRPRSNSGWGGTIGIDYGDVSDSDAEFDVDDRNWEDTGNNSRETINIESSLDSFSDFDPEMTFPGLRRRRDGMFILDESDSEMSGSHPSDGYDS